MQKNINWFEINGGKKIIHLDSFLYCVLPSFVALNDYLHNELCINDVLVVLETRTPKKLKLLTKYNLNLSKGLEFNEAHLLLIKYEKEDTVKCISDGVVIYSNLIKNLLEGIAYSSSPQFEMAAIANLLQVKIKKQNFPREYLRLVEVLEDNYYRTDLDMDKFCSLVYMSRRKVQYLFAKQNTTFLQCLNLYRIEKLRIIFLSKQMDNIDVLISSVGFKGRDSLSRFLKKTEYKNIKGLLAKS